MTNTFKVSLSSFDSWVNEHASLTDDELVHVTGGARTTKAECDEAGMKWSKDKNTDKDGKGQCRA